jgi:hypothetical protein
VCERERKGEREREGEREKKVERRREREFGTDGVNLFRDTQAKIELSFYLLKYAYIERGKKIEKGTLS